MKIMVINQSGSVGKSTITRELLAPRLENSLIIEVEGQNKSSKDFKNQNVWVFDENLDNFYLKLVENENLVVDVGASKIEGFFTQIETLMGIETMFDYFVVPVIPTDKAMEDSLKTILFLKNKGISEDQIKVVFNQFQNEIEFDLFLKATKNLGYNFSIENAIHKNQVYGELGLLRQSLADIFNPDLSFYKDKILKAEKEKKLYWVKVDLANRMGHSAIKNLDNVFFSLFGIEKNLYDTMLKEEKKEDVEISDEDEDL